MKRNPDSTLGGITRIRGFRTLVLVVSILLTAVIAGCGLLTSGLVPATPTDFVVTNATLADRVRLNWMPVPEAGGYEVWRATSPGGTYRLVGTTAHPALDDATAIPGTSYWYKVRACNRAGCSAFTPELPGKAFSDITPPAPTGLAASQGTFTDRVRLTWQAAAGATGYHIYRSAVADGPYQVIATAEGSSYDDADVTVGTTYWYKLRACGTTGCSLLSAEVSGYAASQVPSAPQGLAIAEDSAPGTIALNWEASAGATSYLVHRALAEDATPALLATVTETTYEDTAVQAGTTYWYWVRACNDSGCSPLSEPASGEPAANGGEQPPPPPSPTTSL